MDKTKTIAILAIALMAVTPFAFGGTSGPTPIPNPPTFYITANVVALCGGEINNVPFVIKNAGGLGGISMQNVQLGVTNTRAISNIGTATAVSVNQSGSAIEYVPIFVNASASSLVNAQVNIDYDYLEYYSDSESRNVSFEVTSCRPLVSITMIPQTLTTGNIQNVTLHVTNNGNVSLTSVALRISSPPLDAAWLTSMPISIASLGPHASANASVQALISRNATLTFPVNITAVYYNGSSIGEVGSDKTALSAGLVSMSSSSFATAPSAPTAPGVFSLSFILTDIGTSGASAVTVTPLLPQGIIPYGTNSVFVGDISMDTQTPVTISLIAGKDAKSGSYNVPIRINYLNSLRQNVTAWANTSVVLAPASINSSASGVYIRQGGSAGSGLLTIILVIIVVVLLAMLWRERKRRARK